MAVATLATQTLLSGMSARIATIRKRGRFTRAGTLAACRQGTNGLRTRSPCPSIYRGFRAADVRSACGLNRSTGRIVP